MSKTALITGSNKGIGFETARHLGKKGYRIFLSGRNEKRVCQSLQKLHSEGIDVDKLIMDVSDPESIQKAASEFSKQSIKLDVLINNAAILLQEDRSLLSDDPSIVERTIQTNCFGVINVSREFLKFIPNGGRIINISSGGGSMTDEVGGWSPAYCVSKATVNMITKQLAFELLGKNISVNSLCDG